MNAHDRMLARRRRSIGVLLTVVTVTVAGHDVVAAMRRPGPSVVGPAAVAAAAPVVAGGPAGGRVPTKGPGTFRTAAGVLSRVGTGHLTRYTVEVENGLRYVPEEIAAVVDLTLADPRSWSGTGRFALQRVAHRADADVRVLLATPGTTDRLCAPLETRGQASCRNGRLVVLNARLWTTGTEGYAGRIADYRRYMVNHEMGHALGHRHTTCPGPGRPAPVMMQQTYGLRGCTPNPWPRA